MYTIRDLALPPLSSGSAYSAVVHECPACPWTSRGSGSGGVIFISYKAADVGYDQGLGAPYKDKVFVRLLRQHSSTRAGEGDTLASRVLHAGPGPWAWVRGLRFARDLPEICPRRRRAAGQYFEPELVPNHDTPPA